MVLPHNCRIIALLSGVASSFAQYLVPRYNLAMTHFELRQKFLNFFVKRGHKILPSTSLVPENDPTTLFTGSGMQPMIPYLLGAKHPEGTRIVDIQRCFRGQDIDEVGDNRHDSFFEMMGNWSLGDYFKEDQLAWYFEFLTKELGFDPKKLHVSCFEGNNLVPKDTESAEIWKSLGIPESRINYYGVHNNWWSRSGTPDQMPTGEIGGPDSEVFYEFDIPHNSAYGKKCHPNCDCGKFLEIGNSVFITYQKQTDGSFKELKQKNVDFGGGLERTLPALSNNPDIFTTDLYQPIIKELERVSAHKYGGALDREFRIITDHIKAAVFLISDGVIPSNKDRGYILRRLIRRSVRFGRTLGIESNFIKPTVGSAIKIYSEVYPELLGNCKLIEDTIENEESKFQRTISSGLKEFNKISAKGKISPRDAFFLYESFGFPYELIKEEAKVQKIDVASKDEFEKESDAHKEQSRSTGKGMFRGGLADHSEVITKYHTATHLLQAALRQVLGTHVHQEGSNITGERMRFDFSFERKLTENEIKKITEIVNDQIDQGLERKVETTTYEAAIKSGAMAFFKERYPDKVTVYSFGDFSKEICGGPHVENTKVLGKFTITKEESVAAGIRRIYATLS